MSTLRISFACLISRVASWFARHATSRPAVELSTRECHASHRGVFEGVIESETGVCADPVLAIVRTADAKVGAVRRSSANASGFVRIEVDRQKKATGAFMFFTEGRVLVGAIEGSAKPGDHFVEASFRLDAGCAGHSGINPCVPVASNWDTRISIDSLNTATLRPPAARCWRSLCLKSAKFLRCPKGVSPVTLRLTYHPQKSYAPEHLLAEDDAHLRHSFIHGLCRQHAHVTAVSDGQQAIDRLAHARYLFDLVISNVEMPRLDGWGLLAWVREHEATLQVVIMSGLFPGVFVHTARDNGARGAIPKLALLLRLRTVLMALFDETGQPRLTPFYH